MGIFFGQALADSKQCYVDCYLECINSMEQGDNPVLHNKFVSCAWKCLKKCMLSSGSSDLYYCRLGCSVDACSNSYDDPKKMEGCVNHCSNNICSPKAS
ncbi:thionin-like protein [Trema orientale]|uniref:Thionin-like protein n=1 Tax=Trema orientale TaxID=63057 RepID=A0A2P5CD15_TREOI|nr:thionin-like protein [Trema orientale]